MSKNTSDFTEQYAKTWSYTHWGKNHQESLLVNAPVTILSKMIINVV